MTQSVIVRFVLLVFIQNYSTKAHLNSISSVADCSLYLSIDLNGRTIEESNLILNWPIDCVQRPQIEWIGLYPLDPRKFYNIMHPLLRFDHINETIYRLPLKWRLGLLRFPRGWNRDELYDRSIIEREDKACLDYYVAAFRKSELLAVYCLKVYPRWTSTFRNFSLKQLFIPGSHCSGAYISNQNSDKNVNDHSIEQYTMTQYMDIWSQLVFGIRYLDLSIGYRSIRPDEFTQDHNNDWNYFWIVNENQFIRPLRIIIDDVKRFLTIAKGEILILDFSSFQIGFYQRPERHAKLIQLLQSTLGEIAYRPRTPSSCSDANIGDIMNGNHTLIILYPLEELPHPEDESSILCQSWKRFSSSKMNNLTETLQFMRAQFGKKKSATILNEAWIFNAIRTSIKTSSNSKNDQRWSNIKKGALHFNIKATNWLRGPWGLNANVVTIDYFSNTNLIEIAIKANMQKWLKLKSKIQIL